jgi:hypothetical protein
MNSVATGGLSMLPKLPGTLRTALRCESPVIATTLPNSCSAMKSRTHHPRANCGELVIALEHLDYFESLFGASITPRVVGLQLRAVLTRLSVRAA